ncbi:outer membrane beta-barrel protein [Chitinophaga tropicalis]|nr:outer membrane beta-barrel protein [Chitinophaga tropicalis]
MFRTPILFSLIFFLLFLSQVKAQKSGRITGIVQESAQHTPVQHATVSVINSSDSVLVSYRLTDARGRFSFNNLPAGKQLTIQVNAWQYSMLKKQLTLEDNQQDIDLGIFTLEQKVNRLDTFTVSSIRPPVLVRKDTIEFNAEYFRTLPGAVLEDLLKKLPGVQVSSSGVSVNGKKVSRILVDGKVFFGSDLTIAGKNLPSDIIEAIQVMDDREFAISNPDVREGETPQVINLKLKKGSKTRPLGRFYGGAGTEGRYEIGGILNYFRDTIQASLLGYGNNINRTGFNPDEARLISKFESGGLGGNDAGVQTSAGAGVNLNKTFRNGLIANLQYFYGKADNRLDQLMNRNQVLEEGALISRSDLAYTDRKYNHRVNGRLEYNIDKTTKLIVQPSVLFSGSRYQSASHLLTSDQAGTDINRSDNSQDQKTDNITYNVGALLSHDFKKKGHSLNVTLEVNDVDNRNNHLTAAYNQFFQPEDSTSILNQKRHTGVETLNGYLYASYNNPLTEKIALYAILNISYWDKTNNLSTYWGNTIKDPSLSEKVNQLGIGTISTIGIEYKLKNGLLLRPGISMNTLYMRNRFITYPDFNRQLNFLSPALIVRYKSVGLNYSRTAQAPDMSYLQPVPDNTDPVYINKGNPELLPTRTDNLGLGFYSYDTRRKMNYNFTLRGSLRHNSVVSSRNIDSNGIQVNMPVNADRTYLFYSSGTIGKDFKNTDRQIGINLGYSAQYERSELVLNQQHIKTRQLTVGPTVGLQLNLHDKIEFNQRYSLNINTSGYDDGYLPDQHFTSHLTATELIIRFTRHFVFDTKYDMIMNQQMTGFNSNIRLWNMGATFLFMKKDRLQLKLSVNDLLKSNVNRYRVIEQNYTLDAQYNNLGRFFMATLNYRIF